MRRDVAGNPQPSLDNLGNASCAGVRHDFTRAMRTDRFTQRMQEALQSAQSLAANRNHTEFDNEHFLIALLEQPEGVTRPLFEKIGVVAANMQAQLEAAIAKRAQAHGMTAQTNPAAELLAILRQAEKEMAKLKDEYLSAEHYLLALSDSGVSAGKLLKSLGVTHTKLMQALQQVRGSQRVTDQNP